MVTTIPDISSNWSSVLIICSDDFPNKRPVHISPSTDFFKTMVNLATFELIKDYKKGNTDEAIMEGGFFNTNLRLQRLFGKGLQIDSALGVETTVSFTIPGQKD